MKNIRASLNWFYYWNITRRREQILIKVAHGLPDWLKYRVYIDVVSAATTRPPLDKKIVGDVTAMEVLQEMDR